MPFWSFFYLDAEEFFRAFWNARFSLWKFNLLILCLYLFIATIETTIPLSGFDGSELNQSLNTAIRMKSKMAARSIV